MKECFSVAQFMSMVAPVTKKDGTNFALLSQSRPLRGTSVVYVGYWIVISNSCPFATLTVRSKLASTKLASCAGTAFVPLLGVK